MPIIAFEGLDGVGKTTLAEKFAEYTGGMALTAMVESADSLEERAAVNAGHDVDARFDYFRRLNLTQMAWARDVAADGTFVTLDSSIFCTVATHRVLGSPAALRFKIPGELRPHAGFLLELKEQLRMQRIVQRDGALSHTTHWDERLFTNRVKVSLEYLQLKNQLIRFNTKKPVETLRDDVARRLTAA